MKISKVKVENFASYKELEFDYSNRGLTLIHGPNGAGKSTLCDVIPWVLYGKTAKGGAVDDIISWQASGPTTGVIEVDNITVYRTRGGKANDLYFIRDDITVRGKDLTDTQKLLNAQLGLDVDTYLSGAYVHEFSATASFFVTTPKARRTICEQIVDLNLAKRLQIDSADKRKEAKKALDEATRSLGLLTAKEEYLSESLIRASQKEQEFEQTKAFTIKHLEGAVNQYEREREDGIKKLMTGIKTLLPKANHANCPSCGSPNKAARELSSTQQALDSLRNMRNPYTEQLKAEKSRINTYAADIEQMADQLSAVQTEIDVQLAKESSLKQALGDLELLADIVTTFRSNLVVSTIKNLETKTNELLLNHFDAEIQVTFDCTTDVDVSITKDGNSCVFSQLSKGQRKLLQLCFAVAVMQQVTNYQGVNLPQVFFDEALDGLSDLNKARAFKLLQTLALQYESIFVVDHSEGLKSLFENEISVSLIDGVSTISEGL